MKAARVAMPVRCRLLRLPIVELWGELGDGIRMFQNACAALAVGCVPLGLQYGAFERVLNVLLLLLDLGCQKVLVPRHLA